jgi:hypothetical protein
LWHGRPGMVSPYHRPDMNMQPFVGDPGQGPLSHVLGVRPGRLGMVKSYYNPDMKMQQHQIDDQPPPPPTPQRPQPYRGRPTSGDQNSKKKI